LAFIRPYRDILLAAAKATVLRVERAWWALLLTQTISRRADGTLLSARLVSGSDRRSP
jgi:hypothetical protein